MFKRVIWCVITLPLLLSTVADPRQRDISIQVLRKHDMTPLKNVMVFPLLTGQETPLPIAAGRTDSGGTADIHLRRQVQKTEKTIQQDWFSKKVKTRSQYTDSVKALVLRKAGYGSRTIPLSSLTATTAVVLMSEKNPSTSQSRSTIKKKRIPASYTSPRRPPLPFTQFDTYPNGLLKTAYYDRDGDGQADAAFCYNKNTRLVQLKLDNNGNGRYSDVLKKIGDIKKAIQKYELTPPLRKSQERAYRQFLKAFSGSRLARMAWHGPRKRKQVVLTFDDAPNRRYTPQLLDILRRFDVKATFFVLGKFAEFYPDVMARIADEGHDFGNHSFAHSKFIGLPRWRFLWEIKETEKHIFKVYKRKSVLFRPPYGYINLQMLRTLAMDHYTVVMWDVDSQDYLYKKAKNLRYHVLESVRPGSIVLLHANQAVTVEALPGIISGLKKKGYAICSLYKMLDLKKGVKQKPNL